MPKIKWCVRVCVIHCGEPNGNTYCIMFANDAVKLKWKLSNYAGFCVHASIYSIFLFQLENLNWPMPVISAFSSSANALQLHSFFFCYSSSVLVLRRTEKNRLKGERAEAKKRRFSESQNCISNEKRSVDKRERGYMTAHYRNYFHLCFSCWRKQFSRKLPFQISSRPSKLSIFFCRGTFPAASHACPPPPFPSIGQRKI